MWSGARLRVAEIEATHPHTGHRIHLVEGDITVPGLGVDSALADRLAEVDEVWHLAAVYDLAVDEAVARRVNIEGTANVLDFCSTKPVLLRLHYVSTCYVSGHYDGVFTDEDIAHTRELALAARGSGAAGSRR
jgi:thioester reductase-like protein